MRRSYGMGIFQILGQDADASVFAWDFGSTKAPQRRKR
jgi:hypothetical protein